MKLPRPRKDIMYIPIDYRGHTYILVQDKMELTKENMLLPLSLYNFLVHLDQAPSIEDLQVRLIKENNGLLISKDQILEIITKLDEMFLLESERFLEKKKEIIHEFEKQSVRSYCFAGKSYPADLNQLSNFLDLILSEQKVLEDIENIKAIFAPHIDIQIGKKVYGKTYSYLQGKRFDRVVVLGIGHSLSEGIFCVTDKDFDTPFGVVKNDRVSSNRLKRFGQPLLANTDFEHKFEHSIEFQLIFLKYLLKDFLVVPILCGSLFYMLSKYSREEFKKYAGSFLKELKEIILDPTKKTLVVAGVDMSHVGPKFGHNKSVYELKDLAKAHDLKLLDAIIKRDNEAFWRESISVNDKYNVCGFSALATLMEVVDYKGGKLIDYDLNIEQATNSGVGFAGGILY